MKENISIRKSSGHVEECFYQDAKYVFRKCNFFPSKSGNIYIRESFTEKLIFRQKFFPDTKVAFLVALQTKVGQSSENFPPKVGKDS